MAILRHARSRTRALAVGILASFIGATGSRAETPQEATLPSVAWYAPFYSGGGYCSEAIAFVQSLDRIGASVQIVQHGDGYSHEFVSGLPRETAEMLYRMEANSVGQSWGRSQRGKKRGGEAKDQVVAVCHSEPGAWHPPRWPTARCPPARVDFTVGRTMFETDRLPDGWPERLNGMDQIWVPTEFSRGIFEASGVPASRLRVIGEPVDVDFFDPSKVAGTLEIEGVKGSTVVFLSVFKWEARKGYDVLLNAFYSEFNAKDDVALVILTNAYHDTSDFEAKAARFIPHGVDSEKLPRVFFHRRVDQVDLPRLYARASAFVLPSRGEGWGRPHVEAMSMGVPVIATNWSGPTEYLTRETGYPLRFEGLVPVEEGAFKGHLWAQPDAKHLAELMRSVEQRPLEAAARGARARRLMVERYSPQVLGRRLGYLLRELANARDQKAAIDEPDL